jgi:hypothetical protein
LKKELAWAHVGAKEEVTDSFAAGKLRWADGCYFSQEMRKKFEDVAKATRRLPKIQEGLATAKVVLPILRSKFLC